MFARRRKPTYWDFSINCTGNEAHLSSCKLGHTLAIKANRTCEQGSPVVISCVPGRAFAPAPMAGYRKAFRQEVKPDYAFLPKIQEATCPHEVLLCAELLTLTFKETVKYGTELSTIYQHSDSESWSRLRGYFKMNRFLLMAKVVVFESNTLRCHKLWLYEY